MTEENIEYVSVEEVEALRVDEEYDGWNHTVLTAKGLEQRLAAAHIAAVLVDGRETGEKSAENVKELAQWILTDLTVAEYKHQTSAEAIRQIRADALQWASRELKMPEVDQLAEAVRRGEHDSGYFRWGY